MDFLRCYDGIRSLVLSGSKRNDAIYNKIRYLRSKKVVSQMLLTIIFLESELININLYLWQRH